MIQVLEHDLGDPIGRVEQVRVPGRQLSTWVGRCLDLAGKIMFMVTGASMGWFMV
ncbi:MAG: hypothetical protein R2734_01375 [Nocardioides sp.]